MNETIRPSRRSLLKLSAAVLTSCAMPRVATADGEVKRQDTVRSRLWLFGVPANVDYLSIQHRSVMTAAEGAHYLFIPNIIMVNTHLDDKEQGVVVKDFEPPYDQYAMALRPFRQVVWSIVGAGGATNPEQRAQIIQLAMRTPNIVGLYMDDFFHPKTAVVGALTLSELGGIRRQAKESSKKLDIFVTLYTDQLDFPLGDYLHLIDFVALWNHESSQLKNLEENLKKLHRLAPKSQALLGCYFFDFHARKPVSVADMKLQCETGLRWLREGRIAGMIFLGNSVEDQGFECVEWARNWIRQVGDTTIAL